MRRRKVLAGLGSLAAGGAAVMGSGAFTSVRAQRQVNVDVVPDASAYLGLEPLDERASGGNDGGELLIDFSTSSQGAEGLNPDSRTAFTDLFRVRNNGDNNVVIAIGTERDKTWANPADGEDLLFDNDGLSGFVYAEEQSPSEYGNNGGSINPWGSGESTGLGPTGGFGSIQINGGGRVDANFGSNTDLINKRTLEPGEFLDVDLTLITAEDGPYFDGSTSIIVLAVEPGSDRDFS